MRHIEEYRGISAHHRNLSPNLPNKKRELDKWNFKIIGFLETPGPPALLVANALI